MAENPSSSNVKLKFVAVQAGRQERKDFRLWFPGIGPLSCQGTGRRSLLGVGKACRINVFTVETAKFMDLNPDTVGQPGCRKNGAT